MASEIYARNNISMYQACISKQDFQVSKLSHHLYKKKKKGQGLARATKSVFLFFLAFSGMQLPHIAFPATSVIGMWQQLCARIFYSKWIFHLISGAMDYLSNEVFYSGKTMFRFFEWIYLFTFDSFARQRTSQDLLTSPPADWENPKIVSRNKRPPHTILRCFHSSELALKFWHEQCDSNKACNLFYLTGLVGQPDPSKVWKFCLLDSPENTPSDWQMFDFIEEEWDSVALPNHWQCQGHDIPIYTNTGYPFRFNPPYARRDGTWKATDCDVFLGGTSQDGEVKETRQNPTGLFRTSFTLPSSWRPSDSRICLVFEGVDSALEVWLDGVYVGYSQDSCLPAEFDITDLLQENKSRSSHLLCCRVSHLSFFFSSPRSCLTLRQVMRWSDGSYLEDQDKWWLSGIYREVSPTPCPALAPTFLAFL
jgi:hypothetical protein